MSDIDRQWYWDRRSNKAYYPVAVDEDTVRLITVWHREEFEGAAESGAMRSIDGLAGTREYETTMELIDSFRLPEDVGDGDTAEEVADE